LGASPSGVIVVADMFRAAAAMAAAALAAEGLGGDISRVVAARRLSR